MDWMDPMNSRVQIDQSSRDNVRNWNVDSASNTPDLPYIEKIVSFRFSFSSRFPSKVKSERSAFFFWIPVGSQPFFGNRQFDSTASYYRSPGLISKEIQPNGPVPVPPPTRPTSPHLTRLSHPFLVGPSRPIDNFKDPGATYFRSCLKGPIAADNY